MCLPSLSPRGMAKRAILREGLPDRAGFGSRFRTHMHLRPVNLHILLSHRHLGPEGPWPRLNGALRISGTVYWTISAATPCWRRCPRMASSFSMHPHWGGTSAWWQHSRSLSHPFRRTPSTCTSTSAASLQGLHGDVTAHRVHRRRKEDMWVWSWDLAFESLTTGFITWLRPTSGRLRASLRYARGL
jgi:hypothetical protein